MILGYNWTGMNGELNTNDASSLPVCSAKNTRAKVSENGRAAATLALGGGLLLLVRYAKSTLGHSLVNCRCCVFS